MFKSIHDGIQKIESLLCSIGLLVSTALVFAQVINRYWLHYEIMWLGDLSLYIFVSSYILAIAFTAAKKGHIAVEMIQVKVFAGKPRGLKIYLLVMDIISLLVVVIFAKPVHKFFLRSIKYPEYGTLVRWFNTSWLAYILFGTVVLSAIHLLYHVLSGINDIQKKRWEHTEGGNV